MNSQETDNLLDRIQHGEKKAVNELLEVHRARLKNLVSWRLGSMERYGFGIRIHPTHCCYLIPQRCVTIALSRRLFT